MVNADMDGGPAAPLRRAVAVLTGQVTGKRREQPGAQRAAVCIDAGERGFGAEYFKESLHTVGGILFRGAPAPRPRIQRIPVKRQPFIERGMTIPAADCGALH